MSRIPALMPSITLPATRGPLCQVNIKVITPMFGGSATAGKADPLQPITAKSIRGHLRFWWRACNAGRYASSDEMFKVEEKLWGSMPKCQNNRIIGGPSGIDVQVEITNRCTLGNYQQYNSPIFKYVLFPFSPEGDTNQFLEGVSFRLICTAAPHVSTEEFEVFKKELESAVWAWVNFGGIGARTRRGCGSLFCSTYAPNSLAELLACKEKYISGNDANN